MPEQVLVYLLIQCRVIGDIGLSETSDRGDAEQWCNAGHLPPQVTQDLRRSVFAFLRVERPGTPTLAFRFEEVSYGYPREWQRWGSAPGPPRQILPVPGSAGC